jgi:hypothetical protein
MENVVTIFTRFRFTFDNRIFYLQTVASTDSRYLYSFVQMEGTKVGTGTVLAFRLKQCCGSGMFIPDSGSECFHPGSGLQGLKDSVSGSASKKYC